MTVKPMNVNRRAPRLTAKRVLLTVIVCCLAIDAAVALGAASPGTKVGLKYIYTYTNCTSTSVVDPIDVVWHGGGPTPESVGEVLSNNGWGVNDEQTWINGVAEFFGTSIVDHQYVYLTNTSEGSNGCLREDTQRATGSPLLNRNHVRLFSSANEKGTLFVDGDAHHDEDIFENSACNKFEIPGYAVYAAHISSSFTEAREKLREDWPGKTTFQTWNNSRPIRQCDGTPTKSDGRVLYASATGAGAASFHPQNTSKPVISGTTFVGHTLAVSTGTWSDPPSSYTYQWCYINKSAEACSPIAGATSSTWTPTAAYAKDLIAAQVSPVGASSNDTALSNVVKVFPSKPFFYRGSNGAIWEATNTGVLKEIGGQATGATGTPAAVVLSNGERDVYYRGANSNIYRLYMNPTTEEWSLSDIGGTSAGSPTVAERNPYSVFFRASEGCISCIDQLYLTAGTWHTEWIGGDASGDPTAVASATGVEQVWWTGSDGVMWDWSSPAPASGGWQVYRVGGTATSEKPAIVWHPDGTESVYFRASEGCISCIDQLYWNNSSWRTEWIGGSASNSPVAANEGSDASQNVYWRGSNNTIWAYVGDPATGEWKVDDIGGSAYTAPTEVYEGAATIPVSLYYFNQSNEINDLYWYGGQWLIGSN